MPTTTITNARLLTLASITGRRRGPAQHKDLAVIAQGSIRFDTDTGLITHVAADHITESAGNTIDAQQRVVMPAFIDAHTHTCFAGERYDEWEQKQAGASYLEILQAGGGIMSTVRATREASQDQLTNLLIDRLDTIAAHGTLAIEIKSGYGLSTEHELKMLRAIYAAALQRPLINITPTALIAHALDPDNPNFIEQTINETLPAITAEFPGIAIDAYTEQAAWSLEDTTKLFTAAQAAGHPLRVHTDQFNSLGMTQWACDNNALSVDHLEATPPDVLGACAPTNTFGVTLPCSGFHVDQRYANARRWIDANGSLVIASNYNPGSSPTFSIPMTIALAVRNLGITAAEAITACTANAAALLNLNDRAQLAPGKRADIIMLDYTDERALGYEFGTNPVKHVYAAGIHLDKGSQTS